MLSLSGFKLFLFLVDILPAVLNKRSEAELDAQIERYFLASWEKTYGLLSTTAVVYFQGLAWKLSCNALIQFYSRIPELNHPVTHPAFLMLVGNYSTSFFCVQVPLV